MVKLETSALASLRCVLRINADRPSVGRRTTVGGGSGRIRSSGRASLYDRAQRAPAVTSAATAQSRN